MLPNQNIASASDKIELYKLYVAKGVLPELVIDIKNGIIKSLLTFLWFKPKWVDF